LKEDKGLRLFTVKTMDETKKIICDNFQGELGFELLSLFECTGRVLYEDIISNVNVPSFRRSTVDGYAVLSKDIAGASESIPSILEFKGEIHMGEPAHSKIDFPGQCIYVPTGGMIPDGADCVLMIEYTDKLDEDTILANTPAATLDNLVQVGEDIKKGETVIKKGVKLRPYEIGVLSSLGIDNIKVFKRPKIGIISTGDELVECNIIPDRGQIRDINTNLLYSLVISRGAIPIKYGIIKDEYLLIKAAVEKATDECDIILISGGSSVGTKDYTLKVIEEIGTPGILVHGIAVKPGKPTIVGKAKDKMIFGLPGHPLACAAIYNTLVSFYIDKLTCNDVKKYFVKCEFEINYHKAKGREEYLPVILEKYNGKLIAKPVFAKSGLITGFSKAWGYVKIAKNIEGLNKDQLVEVYKF